MTIELLHVIRDYNIHLQGHASHIKDMKYEAIVYTAGRFLSNIAAMIKHHLTKTKHHSHVP